MRKALNILFFFVLTAIVWLSYPKRSFAQGTFECTFIEPLPLRGCMSFIWQNKCATGYKIPPGGCALYDERSCENSHPCMSEELATDCVTKDQPLIFRECPDGYLDCGRGYQCCKTQRSCDLLPMPGDFSCNTSSGYGVNTAIGCIPAGNLNEFVGWFLSKLIFIASGIAFLLMAFGAFKIITSAGSPEKIQAGKELITSSLAGLVFIILSLFLLKLIGVDILQIPGF